MTPIVAGFLLGLAGSGHCALMCGPLTLALHGGSGAAARRAFALHQAGRLAMYAAAGALAGALGRAAGLAGLGRVLAVSMGAAMLLRAAIGSRSRPGAGVAAGRMLARVMAMATRTIGPRPRLQAVALGAINGLLPCGMIYAALTASIAFGSVTAAVLFMLAFGVGALPALAAVRGAAPLAARLFSRHAPLAARLALVVLGAALVAQGLRAPASVAATSAAHAHQHGAP